MSNIDPLLFRIRPDHIFLTTNPKKPVENKLMFYVANPNEDTDTDVTVFNPDGLTPQDELPDIHNEVHQLSRIFIWFPYRYDKIKKEENLSSADHAEKILVSPGGNNKNWHCKRMHEAKIGVYWMMFPKKNLTMKPKESVSFIISGIISDSIPGMTFMYVKNSKLPDLPARRTEMSVIKIEPVSIQSFQANPQKIVPGQSIELSWTTKKATDCIILPNINHVEVCGERSVQLKKNTKFKLNAFGPAPKGFVESTQSVKFKDPGWYLKTKNTPWQTGTYESFAFKLDEKQWFLANHYNNSSVDLWSTKDGGKFEKICDRLPFSIQPGYPLQFCTLNGIVWVIRSDAQEIWRSPEGSTWEKVTVNQQRAWPQRAHGTFVAHAGKLWLMGGFFGDDFFNDVCSSEDGIDWDTVTQHAPWSPRAGMSAVSFNQRLWILGGAEVGRMFSEIWSTIDGRTWTKSPTPLWEGRIEANLLIFHDKLWLIGGGGPAPLNDVWVMDKFGNWLQVNYPIPWNNITNMGGVVFDRMIWLAGGRNNCRSVWSFIPQAEER